MNDELIPLSHLQLDLDAPSVGGWDAYLAGAASQSRLTISDVQLSPVRPPGNCSPRNGNPKLDNGR
jgi:hypothetical protein